MDERNAVKVNSLDYDEYEDIPELSVVEDFSSVYDNDVQSATAQDITEDTLTAPSISLEVVQSVENLLKVVLDAEMSDPDVKSIPPARRSRRARLGRRRVRNADTQ